METSMNIWTQFSFSENKQKSALDYLNEFKQGLVDQTKCELIVEIDAVYDEYIVSEHVKLTPSYSFYVVAPKLGRYRRKILTVTECGGETERFPVDIVNHYSVNVVIKAITESDFENTISDILLTPVVKSYIENLYQLSKERNTII